MINPDGSLTCCDKRFKNCPVVHPRTDGVAGFVIEGDDGQMIEFNLAQWEVLMDEGVQLLDLAGL